MDPLTLLFGVAAITLLTPVMMIFARHIVTSPPYIMKAIAIIGIMSLLVYFYRQDLWLMALVLASNILWINIVYVSSTIGERGNYRLTHLLNATILIFMVLSWWFLSLIIDLDITSLSKELILASGTVLSVVILMLTWSWVPEWLKEKHVILPLVIGCQLMFAMTCYQEDALIGVGFYIVSIAACLSYRHYPNTNESKVRNSR